MWPSVGVLPSGRYVPYWHCTHCSRKSKLSSMDVSLPLYYAFWFLGNYYFNLSHVFSCPTHFVTHFVHS